MLPLHGQGTAAVECKYHWAGSIPHVCVSGDDVFGKQAGPLFAEFLSSFFDNKILPVLGLTDLINVV